MPWGPDTYGVLYGGWAGLFLGPSVRFVLGAVLSWGLYGVSLHRGQVAIGSPLIGSLWPLNSEATARSRP